MEFVKKFTPTDFQAKSFTPSISPNFNSFSDKNTKNEWKWRNLQCCTKILYCRWQWRQWQISPLPTIIFHIVYIYYILLSSYVSLHCLTLCFPQAVACAPPIWLRYFIQYFSYRNFKNHFVCPCLFVSIDVGGLFSSSSCYCTSVCMVQWTTHDGTSSAFITDTDNIGKYVSTQNLNLRTLDFNSKILLCPRDYLVWKQFSDRFDKEPFI